ncbi:hypothetical protein [Streptomyces sp. NPDC047718]|uniref:hypothetical protein n=1 Tax=Streptomyces sp. NPDC047718 TaxID=3155479 RepID=UPI0033CECBB2
MNWLDRVVAAGQATAPAHPSRIAVLDAIRADRTGPIPLRLLHLARTGNVFVRRESLDLLASDCAAHPWPEAAETAITRLTDEDEEVRRRAARLVIRAGDRNIGLQALADRTDPIVRTTLADLLGDSVTHLRNDPQPSVRFLAHLRTLAAAPAGQWPALDTALLTDAPGASRYLERVGQRWGWTLYRLGREQHVYALAARLLDHRLDLHVPGVGGGPVRHPHVEGISRSGICYADRK